MEKDSSFFKKLWPYKFDSAIILTVITAYVYLITYLFEKGYCEQFKIPVEYIKIDINSILIFGAKTVVFLIFFGAFTYLIWAFAKYKLKNSPVIKSFLKMNVVLLISYGLATYCFPFATADKYILIALLLLGNSYNFIKHRKDIFNRKHISESEPEPESEPDIDYSKVTMDQFELVMAEGRAVVITLLIMFFSMSVMFVSTVGEGEARRETEFWVKSDDRSLILIRRFGDEMIFKAYDYKKKQLTNRIVIVNISDSNSLLSLEKITLGPIGRGY